MKLKGINLKSPKSHLKDVEWREPAVAIQWKGEQLRGPWMRGGLGSVNSECPGSY